MSPSIPSVSPSPSSSSSMEKKVLDEKCIDLYDNKIYTQIGAMMGASYLKPELADVYFTFNVEGKKIERLPAHKLLLAAKSSIFLKIFTSDPNSDEIEVDDTTRVGFQEFLQFFYLPKVKLSMDNIVEVVNLGKKYNVADCLLCCERFLVNALSKDNVTWIYQIAVCYELNMLVKQCMLFWCTELSKMDSILWALKIVVFFNLKPLIRKCERQIGVYAKEILNSKQFVDCDRQILARVLSLKFLDCSELELFNAVMKWVRTASKQEILTEAIIKEHLGDLLDDIRIEAMSTNEWSSVISSQVGQLELIQSRRYESRFSNQCRTIRTEIPWNRNAVITCERRMNTNKYDISQLEILSFTTQKAFVLGGFDLSYHLREDKFYNTWSNSTYNHWNGWNGHTGHSNIAQENKQTVKITITQVTKGSLVPGISDAILHCDSYRIPEDKGKIAMLPKPLLIKPNFFYMIQMEQCADAFYSYEAKPLKLEVTEGFEIHFHTAKKNGSISKLYINMV